MSNLTDLLPAGAGGKQVSFVASGTIGNGVTVALNSDGTVTAVASVSQATGSPVVFEAADIDNIATSFDSSNNKVVIFYTDDGNSSYGTAIVGTVSGSSISFGSAVVFNSSTTIRQGSTFDSSNNKVIVAYRNGGNANYGTAKVGTVSGTSISFGSATVFEAASTTSISAAFDVNSNKVVIAYTDSGNSNYGTSVVGTVSGTSISFGSATVFTASYSIDNSATFDSNSNKIVIAFRNVGNSSYGTAIVGTVSGTSISFGSAVVFESASSNLPSIAFDLVSNKIVIAYYDGGNSNYGTAIVGTVSGTSISFGSSTVFNANTSTAISNTFDLNSKQIVIAYRDNVNSNYGTVISGAVSGTSISFASPVVFESASTTAISTTFDSNSNKIAIAYRDSGNFNYGTAITFSPASSNNTDFIGISDAAISDTASGSVTIKGGISTNVTGLTANLTYYVQTNGTLSTTVSSVLAGKALSSTSINLDYTT